MKRQIALSHKFLCFLSIFLYSLIAYAQSDRLEIKDLNPKTKNTSDLINQEITVASKSEESINDAPASISVITATEIERFGANNLLEVIERIASTYTLGTYFAPNNLISLRGDLATPYNNHILLLINGRPTRENLFGGLDFPIFLAFPLQNIARIEVIRGPGSVLYGSNAYVGVINIITKEATKDETQAQIETGSWGTFGLGTFSTKVKENLTLTTGARYFQQDGWQFDAIGEDGKPLSLQARQNNFGFNFNLKYKSLNITSLIAHSSQNNTGVLPSVFPIVPGQSFRNRTISNMRSFLDIGYEHNFNKNNYLATNLTLNSMLVRFANPSGDFVGRTQDALVELTDFWQIKPNLNFLAGATAYFQSGIAEIGEDFDRGVKSYNKLWYNAYVQMDYSPIAQIKLVAGGQFNKPNNVPANFVPRLGLIGYFNKNLGVKFLYNQAFRAAFEAELSLLDKPILQGSPNLRPELIENTDLVFFYNNSKLRLAATYYNSQQKQLINQVPIINEQGATIISYTNTGRLSMQGVEIDAKYALNKDFFVTGSFTHQRNRLNDSINNRTLVPPNMFKIGAFYNFETEGINIGIFNTYFDNAGDIPTATFRNPNARGFNSLSAKVSFNLSKLFKSLQNYAVQASFYGTNLLNSRIHYPEFVRRNINSIPGRGGIAIYANIGISF